MNASLPPVSLLQIPPAERPSLPQVVFVRSRRAKRYRLLVRRDGTAMATVPWGGSLQEARNFVERHSTWLRNTQVRFLADARQEEVWRLGTELWLGGQLQRLEAGGEPGRPAVRLGQASFRVADPLAANLRPELEKQFAILARRKLPPRTWELAAQHRLELRRVVVRNQRSRWGSCSASGTISLNWRLIQAPAFVQDYILLHELAHLREMNHSRRFWALVAEYCPDYQAAETWLTKHERMLGL